MSQASCAPSYSSSALLSFSPICWGRDWESAGKEQEIEPWKPPG